MPPSYNCYNIATKYTKYTLPESHFIGHNLWILKPTKLNRGRGVHIFRSLDSLRDLVSQYTKGRKSFTSTNEFIIQKYIEAPLLINRRKFDIRMWVLITGEMDCLLFREGYIRTSSIPFVIDHKNIDDKFVHLTNNAIQQHSQTYGSFEDGNQVSFDKFKEYLGGDLFERNMLMQIKQLVVKSLLAVKKKLNPRRSEAQFEIFGYDFMIDSDYHVWLIEVNTNPCLEESSSLLKFLLPRMIDDAFKLTLDRVFHKAKRFDGEDIKYSVKGYDDDYNMW